METDMLTKKDEYEHKNAATIIIKSFIDLIDELLILAFC